MDELTLASTTSVKSVEAAIAIPAENGTPTMARNYARLASKNEHQNLLFSLPMVSDKGPQFLRSILDDVLKMLPWICFVLFYLAGLSVYSLGVHRLSDQDTNIVYALEKRHRNRIRLKSGNRRDTPHSLSRPVKNKQ